MRSRLSRRLRLLTGQFENRFSADNSSDDVKKRLGRSTDCGDAVVLAFWSDPRAVYAGLIGRKMSEPDPAMPRPPLRDLGGWPQKQRREIDWAAAARSKWVKG